MKYELHTATSRGFADHNWLKSNHSFSFASYFNPDRMGFGLLRVLNDDIVAPGKGFDTHPHKDMEIVSIPLSGTLEHKDSEGNETLIRKGEVQLMSAGTGVRHSEHNHSSTEDVNFLQIWVKPEKKRIAPRYDQKKFDLEQARNNLILVVAPIGSNLDCVEINQQAYFSLGNLSASNTNKYSLRSKDHGVYIFVIDGSLKVNEVELNQKDALAITEVESLSLAATSDSEFLIIEVPLHE